ncbi:hypothetical protein NGRA_2349 [Nosema granulosis]|uniref:Uncharacterized protein n=1 Tax=Nosema granulosis TaxID=83296 RepID=A0A9P6KYA5_9MICR|nr:hypothetical protein NGRA_2349 [Nosema granulosis]
MLFAILLCIEVLTATRISKCIDDQCKGEQDGNYISRQTLADNSNCTSTKKDGGFDNDRIQETRPQVTIPKPRVSKITSEHNSNLEIKERHSAAGEFCVKSKKKNSEAEEAEEVECSFNFHYTKEGPVKNETVENLTNCLPKIESPKCSIKVKEGYLPFAEILVLNNTTDEDSDVTQNEDSDVTQNEDSGVTQNEDSDVSTNKKKEKVKIETLKSSKTESKTKAQKKSINTKKSKDTKRAEARKSEDLDGLCFGACSVLYKGSSIDDFSSKASTPSS